MAMVDCLHCGESIDAGHYKDDDEKEHELDTFDRGNVHVTLGARLGFRQRGGLGRLHVDCFHDVIGEGRFDPEEWGEAVRDD